MTNGSPIVTTTNGDSLDEQINSCVCKPNHFTYTTLIYGQCKEGNLQKAIHLYREMIECGLKPDAFSYTVLIWGHCKENNIWDALKLYADMLKNGVVANAVTYNVLIITLQKNGELELACKFSDECAKVKITK